MFQLGKAYADKMSSNLWDDAEDNQSQFSRSDRYSRSRFQHDSRETRYVDSTSQQTSGKMWGDADQNSSQFSPGSRIMSDRLHGYGRGSNYDFQQESQTDTTSHTRDGLRPSFRDVSFEKDQRIDYFGTQSRGLTGMESEITWTSGSSRSGLEMDRLTNTAVDTVSRFGMELTGQTSTPNVEKDLSKFLSRRSNTLHPMENGSKRLDTFEGGRSRPDIEKPTNLSEPGLNSNRTRGPYYQPRNETRSEWSHESHRGQSTEPFRETEHYRFGDMSRRTPVLQGMEQGLDSSVLDTGVMQELRMRMAAERQHSGENAVDMNKVMKIVDQFSEEHTQNLSQSIGAITRGSYGKEAAAPPQESRSLKRGGSMHGISDDSIFKRGRMEGFIDRPRPSSYQQTETLRRPHSGIQPRPSSYQQTETPRRPQSSFQPRPSSYQQTETLRRPQSSIQPRPSRYQQTETPRRPQSSIQPRPSSYQQTETLRRTQSSIQPRPNSYQQTETLRRPQSSIQPRPSSYQQTETLRRQQSSIQPIEKTVPLLSFDLGIQDQGLPSAPETFESKLERLIAYIRSYRETDDHVNDIHTLDIFMAKSKLKKNYKWDLLGKIGKKLTFTGSLQVNNVFLARSAGASKKEVKHACYEKAMAVLMTNPVSQILKFEDEGIEKLKMKLLADEEEKKAKEVVVAAAAAPPPLTFREKLEKKKAEILAAAPPPPFTLREKFEKLIHYLNSFKKRADTPMNELNIANVSANLVFHREYKEESIELWGNFCLVKGLLMLDGHLIATAVAKEPKCVRYKTFTKGVEFLKKSPMSVILEGVPADDDYTNLSAHEVLSHRHVSLPDQQTEQKLGRMINEVKNIVASKQPPSNTLQITSKNNHLLLTCLFKKRTRGAEQFAECDLYIDCIYICSGEGYKYADAVKRANEEAVRVLCNSSSDLIFNNFKRITTQDLHNVAEVCELWEGKRTKTFFWSNCAKIQLLKKKVLFKTNPDYTKFPRDWEGMTVMEQGMFSSDRLNKAYEILLHTATKSFVTMFGKGTTEGNLLKCELFLQGEKLAEATGKSNLEASAKAAAQILFKLYQHQPVIKLLPEGDDSKSWHTHDSIKEKADKMKAESEDSETDDFIYINDFSPVPKQKVQEELMEVDQVDADKDTISSSHSVLSEKHTDVVEDGDSFVGDSDAPSSTLPVNKWVKKVVEKMIAEYAGTENLEELIFGPGFPLGDQKQIRITASKHRVYSGVKTATDKQNYVCVYQKLSPEATLQTLRLNDGKCGRYALIPKEELPRLNDLQDSFGLHDNLKRSLWKSFNTKGGTRGGCSGLLF